MVRSLIVNADDFGHSANVNQAIIQAHTNGILTSTSLMVTAAAADEAVTLAKKYPNLAIGLHLVLVCGRSALPPEQIPHLVDANGNFLNDPLQAGLRYQFNRATRQELRQEIRAQLEKFQQTGLPLSHVDGHLHLHLHPVVLNILIELAAEFDIKAIRLPSEELLLALQFNHQNLLQKLLWAGVFGQLRRYGERLLGTHQIHWIDRVYGLMQTGAVTEDYWLYLIPRLQADSIEIYCHPSSEPPDRSANGLELQGLLSATVRQMLDEYEFKRCRYRDVLENSL
jgi:chitin disaccharide deacetylase